MTDAKETARIVSDRPRFKTVALDWPVEFGGKIYKSISISRLTAADVAKFQNELEVLLKNDSGARVRLPLFKDEDGNDVPVEVMDAMDSDDRDNLDKEAFDFLPQRFRALAEADTTSETGGSGAPTSGA